MKNLLKLSAVALSISFAFACSNSKENINEAMPPSDTSNGVSAMVHDTLHGEIAYICPCGGCPEIRESKPGKCSKCELELVEEKK
ncbi:MAG: heavy metal-binding domain-containing protein [Bacteroidota bacterium]